MESGRKKTFVWLTTLLYVIAALHIVALYFFWYWSIWWYDILVHVLGGVWIGGMALFLISKWISRDLENRFIFFGVPILAIAAIGLLWEAFEWNIDQIVLSRFSNDPVDTLSDLGAGIAGALTYAFFLSGRASKDRGIKDSEFAND